MPSVAAALLAMALRDPRPLTDSGVWVDPLPSSRVVAPLDVTGEAQAPEGVLRVELWVVRGGTSTLAAAYTPEVPVGTVAFALRWDPGTAAPGTVTLRVVASTLVRGLSADVDGLTIPGPPRTATKPATPRRNAAPAPRRVAAAPVRRAVATTVLAPRYDDSGTAFGHVAATLPYTAPVAAAAPPPAAATPAAAPVPVPPDRSGWLSVAAGLLVLLVSSHLHRALRPQPDPRGGR
ncbi:MAG TPA: hypothetical protein VFQ85_18910 [Mycobacteriales bacterium]|jgi:hypothetical protein|nr:hypothetical protein [Mycobacteriales bacterium]